MHLDTEQIQRAAHDELDDPSVRTHLDTCADCRARVDAAAHDDSEIARLLGVLDAPPPRIDPATLRARARADTTTPRGGWGRWAAAVFLAAGIAGAAYAVPGSPVPTWLDTLRGAPAAPTARQAPPSRPDAPAGIAVASTGRLAIVFTPPLPRGEVRVRLTADALLHVQAVDGDAAFTARGEGIDVASRSDVARYEIRIPRDAPSLRIRFGDTLVFEKTGDRVTSMVPAEADGSYALPFD